MKRWLCLIGLIAAFGAALVQGTSRGQVPGAKPAPGDLGPGEQGATLRMPGMEPSAPVAANPFAAPNPYAAPIGGTAPISGTAPDTRIALPPSNHVDINKDIEITPGAGPWVIFFTAYKGPNAPEMARKCVGELRSTFKLSAYVYNYGAKEKQKEYERVQALRKQQLDALAASPLAGGTVMPIRVRTMKIDEQTGVLIAGNYQKREEALKAVEKIRKFVPDPRRMDLEIIEVQIEHFEKFKIEKVDTVKDGKSPGRFYDNPFMTAFPTRNPSLGETTRSTEDQAADLKLLQHLNKAEKYSLLNCKKPFTLTIKQFNCQVKDYRSKEEKTAFFDRFDKSKGDWHDIACSNAQNLAEAFRKGGLAETYVLHCKHCSYVTVGGYDKIDDPRLVAMQNYLETQFKADGYRPLELFPRPCPMAVPR